MGQAKKVVKVRRRKSINIGFVVFLIVFVYLAANVFMYFTKTHLSIYEVMDGTTADDTIVEGVILRKEKLISTSRAGYINYYQKEGSRVSKKSKLYSIDESKKFYELLENSGDGFQFSSSDIDTVKKEILKFTCNYDKVNYKNVKDFKYNINNTIAEITMEQLMDQAIDQMDKLNFQVVQSKYSGILTYHFDGYEELKAKNVNPDTFNKENYKQEQLRTNDIIAIDSPVCKIVTSEDWQVVTMLSEEQYKKLEEKSKKSSKLKVTILKNDFTTYVPFELTKKDDVYYATLSFDKYMINHMENPFMPKMRPMFVNLVKEANEYKVIVDLTQIEDEKALNVDIKDNELTVKGEFDRNVRGTEKIINFTQTYYLDEKLDEDKITKEKKGNKYIITIPFKE